MGRGHRRQAKQEAKKQKTKSNPAPTRAKGKSRAELVLEIVKTDNTFYVRHSDPHVYVGKCIHCNSHLYVTMLGETDATVEHIQPLCNGGDARDPRNLALACKRCNNQKGVHHDQHAGKGGRADEVIAALHSKRVARWKEPT